MSDGTATPEPGSEPEPGHTPEPAAWPQPGATPQPGAPGPPHPDAAGAWPPAGQPAQPAQPGYAPGGYPPPPAAAYPSAPYGSAPAVPGQYAPPPASRTDGVAIAALVTGVLGMGVIPLVLGILGLRRTKQNGTQGRGLALAGIILGAIEIVVAIVVGIVIVAGVVTYNSHIDGLRSDCSSGDMAACDTLYQDATFGSDDEEFGWTCGGRTDGGADCEVNGAVAYGDSAELDALWDSCEAGDMAACDDLYNSSPVGSEYEEFGDTCGGQSSGGSYCDSGISQDADEDSSQSSTAGGSYGDDPELDALWDACAAGSGAACDDLYMDSPSGSEYEDFGTTCGNRLEFAWSCEEEIGA